MPLVGADVQPVSVQELGDVFMTGNRLTIGILNLQVICDADESTGFPAQSPTNWLNFCKSISAADLNGTVAVV
jgi:hypothetical protein